MKKGGEAKLLSLSQRGDCVFLFEYQRKRDTLFFPSIWVLYNERNGGCIEHERRQIPLSSPAVSFSTSLYLGICNPSFFHSAGLKGSGIMQSTQQPVAHPGFIYCYAIF